MFRIFVLFFIASSPVSSSTVNERRNQCAWDEYRCGDGSCIKVSDACDGVTDCVDGSDELACDGIDNTLFSNKRKRSVTCNESQWTCGDGSCINVEFICDGLNNCRDASDENSCETKSNGMVFLGNRCVLPPYPDGGTFVVDGKTNVSLGETFDRLFLNITCNPGFVLESNRSYAYCLTGYGWLDPMPKCLPYCSLDKEESVDYQCLTIEGTRACGDLEPNGTVVRPVCKTLNYTPGHLPNMHCIDGVWDYVATCISNENNITIDINHSIHINIPSDSDTVHIQTGRVEMNITKPRNIKITSNTNTNNLNINVDTPTSSKCDNIMEIKLKNNTKTHLPLVNNNRPNNLTSNKPNNNSRDYIDESFWRIGEIEEPSKRTSNINASLPPANNSANEINSNNRNNLEDLFFTYLNSITPITNNKLSNKLTSYNYSNAYSTHDSDWSALELAGADTDDAVNKTTSKDINKSHSYNYNSSANGTYESDWLALVQAGVDTNDAANKPTNKDTNKSSSYNYNSSDYGTYDSDWLALVLAGVDSYNSASKITNNDMLSTNSTSSTFYAVYGPDWIDNNSSFSDNSTNEVISDNHNNYDHNLNKSELRIKNNIDSNKTTDKVCGILSKQFRSLTTKRKIIAQKGEVPWHAEIFSKLSYPYTQICGGSLVSTSVIISAAHCFWTDKLEAPTNYAVAVGKKHRRWDSLDLNAQTSDVADIKIPPRFQGSITNFQDDIAIIRVVKPFVYQAFVSPICVDFDVSFDDSTSKTKYGKFAGWGSTSSMGNPSTILKVIDLPYVGVDECIATAPFDFKPYITSDKICAGYANGPALCRGDGGGGLAFRSNDTSIERYYLRGIASSTPAPMGYDLCFINTMSTFTNLAYHKTFVSQYLN